MHLLSSGWKEHDRIDSKWAIFSEQVMMLVGGRVNNFGEKLLRSC